MNRGTYAEFAA